MTLAIHFQFMNGVGDLAEQLLKTDKQFIASVVPNLFDPSMRTVEGAEIYNRIHLPDNYYSEESKEFFRELAEKENVVFVQEGYRHSCGRCYDKFEKNVEEGRGSYPDSYHEHVCLDGEAQSYGMQVESMAEGRKILRRNGIEPLGYCAPNHLWNRDTLSAVANLDYGFFMTRNLIGLPNYLTKVGGRFLHILPEAKVGSFGWRNSPVVYTFYDRDAEAILDLLKTSEPLRDLERSLKPAVGVWLNDELVIASKKARDWKKRLKI